jgi:predicted ATPase
MAVWQARVWRSQTLVGAARTRQFKTLVECAERAWDGQGQVVLLAGEAGAGKTRLIREIRQVAGQRQVRVLEGACFEPDRAVPLALTLDMLRPLLREADAEIGRLLSEPIGPEDARDPDERKRRVFAALFTLIRDLADTQPLLMIFEDVHLADDASLEFLRLLARRATQLPVLVLVSYRIDETTPSSGHTLADLQRQRLATELVLLPLTRADTEGMLQAIVEPGRAFGPSVVDRIFALTEGNPLFVEEVLASVVAADDVTTLAAFDHLAVPRTIRDAVQRRVELIGAEAHQVLVLASVLGRGFDFRTLEHLTGYSEGRLLELMRELIAAGLVAEESAERFVFRHALTQQAVYGELLARERRALHRRALESLEGSSPVAHGPTWIEDLAYHAHAAADWPKALEYCRKAGDRAHAMHAPGTAVEHFSRALDAGRQLGLAPSAAVLRGRGQAYETLGAFDLARSDLEVMSEVAHASGDRIAEWQALLDLGFLRAARDYSRARAYLDDALALARQLDDPTPLAHSLNRLGNWYMNADAPDAAIEYHEQALAIFERLDDTPGLASTLDLLGLAEALAASAIVRRRGISAPSSCSVNLATAAGWQRPCPCWPGLGRATRPKPSQRPSRWRRSRRRMPRRPSSWRAPSAGARARPTSWRRQCSYPSLTASTHAR